VTRRRTIAAVALAVALVLAAAVAVAGRGGDATDRVSTVAPTTTTAPAPPSTRRTTTSRPGPTSTVAPTTTPPTAAPTTPTVAAAVAPTSPPPPPATPPTPAPTPGGLGAVRGRTIAIDPGHNGGNYAHASEIGRPIFIGTQTRACDTTGTQTADGYTEAAYNLDVALRLRDVLAGAGANVVMSRTTNDGWGPCIDERAAFGNRAHAAVAISVHADGGPPDGRGFHVNMPALVSGYTDDIYAASHRLGVDVRDAYTATGMPTSTYFGSQGLVERSDLGGLNLSDVPKVIVETGNMRSATDAALLENADFRGRAAQALAVGIARYLAGG
jgi:N-acetylmuramoyl-L-alanine amidase